MPKPNSIYSYNLGKANGVGSSGNVYSFTNRQNGGLGPAAYFPNRNIVEPVAPTQVITQLTEYVGEYNGEYYIALLFKEPTYIQGIDDVVTFFNNQFPNTKLNFIKYIVNNSVTNVDSILTEFITLYPDSNKAVVCELTSIITASSNFINKRNLNILTLCLTATGLTTKTLKNAISYGYYLNRQVSCCFPIIEEYGFQNIVLLFEKKSSNFAFMNSYIDTINLQNKMLKNIPTIEYTFDSNDESLFYIPEHSFVVLMVDTISINKNIDRILNSFNNNKTSLIFMSNLNYDITDIFENIPAIVAISVPCVYTKTSDLVFQCINKNNKSPYYSIYPFYDILYTLNYCADNKIFITKKTYLNVNPFYTISPAWSSGYSVVGDYNNFTYGYYDFIFTKDTIIDKDRVLYDKYNKNGSLARAENSRSIFRSIGVFPNLPTPLVYLERDYIKIYQNGVLRYVKFDINNTNTEYSNLINSSQTSKCKFFTNFDRTTFYLNYLEKIFDNKKFNYPDVNDTMSKTALSLYFKPANHATNNKAIIEVNEKLKRDNFKLRQEINNVVTLEEKLAKLTQELNEANSKKLQAIVALSKSEKELALLEET